MLMADKLYVNGVDWVKFVEEAFNFSQSEDWNPYLKTRQFGALKPTRIIFSDPATICYFPDGDKVVVKCSEGERFVPEYGVMACIIKKIYGTRSQFLKVVEKGYNQKKAREEFNPSDIEGEITTLPGVIGGWTVQ